VRVLIRAMASIVREVDARLVLAGPVVSRQFEQSLRDGIRELGLEDKVELAGTVDHDQIPTLIATASVCVVPSASDLTPNPTVVYPTKLLEYMACRRPIVAPRRETVQMVVENGREALLFEPGDPIDLARKVLRLLAEPALCERIASAAYERVRRDFTASAARRAVRKAYELVIERFGSQFHAPPGPGDDEPKVEMLADDDYEATVFEEPPQPPVLDTALTGIAAAEDSLVSVLESLDEGGHTSSVSVVAPPPPPDQTMERRPVRPPGDARGVWTIAAPVPPPPSPTGDDWVVTNAVRPIPVGRDSDEETPGPTHDDGTPVQGTPHSPPIVSPTGENAFVAGEIDVPTPTPESTAAAVEFTAASKLLGPTEPEPDTGTRTPTIERARG